MGIIIEIKIKTVRVKKASMLRYFDRCRQLKLIYKPDCNDSAFLDTF